MAALVGERRVGTYTLSDTVIVFVLGILGGIVNTTISSIPHAHFQLWGTQTPYLSFFTIAPVVAMLLLRKPGVALATALVYAIVQSIAKANPSSLPFGLEEGLGAEIVFALFRFRVDPANFGRSALAAFLAGGIGAKTIGGLVSWAQAGNNGSGMMMGGMMQSNAPHYAPWQTFLGNEILGLIVSGVLSGLVGWVLAELILRTHVVERMRVQLDRMPAPSQQGTRG